MPNPPIGPPGTAFASRTGLTIPNIPPATDLPSAISAIFALTQAINVLANNIPANAGGGAGQGSGFVVTNQTTELVTIFDPNDNQVFVQVQQVTSLELTNSVTGETWKWAL